MEVVLLLGTILVAQGYTTSRLSIRSLGLLSPLFSTESKVLHNLHISLVVPRFPVTLYRSQPSPIMPHTS